MKCHQYILTWRWAGLFALAALAVAPWLAMWGGRHVPAGRLTMGDTVRPSALPEPSTAALIESPQVGGKSPPASAWVPELAPQTRQVLTTVFATTDVPTPVGGETSPLLIIPQLAARPLADNQAADALTPEPPTKNECPAAAVSTATEPAVAPPVAVVVAARPAAPVIEHVATVDKRAAPISEPTPPAEAKSTPAVAPPSAATAAAMPRSEALEQMAQDADRHSRHAFDLAGRNAYFAARAELVTALRRVAEGLDNDERTTSHSRALAAAITAIGEAEDFIPRGARLEADLDVPGIIDSHRTSVLKGSGEKLPPLGCLRTYMTYAQAQLAEACGHETAGSMALYGLGKVYVALAEAKGPAVSAPEAKAVAFFQAAILTHPQNYLAANELGVLLARCGNLADARLMLEHSVATQPNSIGWQNLAAVYRQLGQPALSQQAAWQAMVVQQTQIAHSGAGGQPVQWVDPRQFAVAGGSMPVNPASAPASVPPGYGRPAVAMPGQAPVPPGTPAMARRPAPAGAVPGVYPWPARRY